MIQPPLQWPPASYWRMAGPSTPLVLITRLPQRGPHLAVHLASWDELASRSISFIQISPGGFKIHTTLAGIFLLDGPLSHLAFSLDPLK